MARKINHVKNFQVHSRSSDAKKSLQRLMENIVVKYINRRLLQCFLARLLDPLFWACYPYGITGVSNVLLMLKCSPGAQSICSRLSRSGPFTIALMVIHCTMFSVEGIRPVSIFLSCF